MTLTAANRTELDRIASDYPLRQAQAEGDALAGRFGVERQLVAMSALYLRLRTAGRLDEARAVKAEAQAINAAAAQQEG